MDTKLKRSKPFLVWLCFFVGVNMLIMVVLIGLCKAYQISGYFNDIVAAIKHDTKDMQSFKFEIVSEFQKLAYYVSEEEQVSGSKIKAEERLNAEGTNLIYYAYHGKTNKTATNLKPEDKIITPSGIEMPEGYDYLFSYKNGSFSVIKAGEEVDILRIDSGYRYEIIDLYHRQADPDLQVYLMVSDRITENPYDQSILYQIEEDARAIRWYNYTMITLLLVAVMLLVISTIKRQNRMAFTRKLVQFSGFFWFEVKAVISVLILAFIINGFQLMIGITGGAMLWNLPYSFSKLSPLLLSNPGPLFMALLCFWWFWLMALDIRHHKSRFIKHNVLTWAFGQFKVISGRKAFQKAMLRRILFLVAAEAILIIFGGIALYSGRSGIPALTFTIIIGIVVILCYLKQYSRTVNDMGLILDRIEAVKNGDLTNRVALFHDSDFYQANESINAIQTVINRTVEERMKSEHMKVELITNVSHDLKTPLTAIISYVDLLSKEEGLPEHVMDYIRILGQKSNRLKVLISDIFDLTRATTGALEVEMTQLDPGKLITQTLADMGEQIEGSGLIFKTNLPEEPVMIMSDGKKLYRVLQNLISNVLKYAMPQSRVYVDLMVEDGRAVIEIKNIAGYEMNFKEDEIVERFVRGDKARSTEGSGLGLSIAQNFTQACGGSFEIKVDGDLFKARLIFPVAAPDEAPEPEDTGNAASDPETGVKVLVGTDASIDASPSPEADTDTASDSEVKAPHNHE